MKRLFLIRILVFVSMSVMLASGGGGDAWAALTLKAERLGGGNNDLISG